MWYATNRKIEYKTFLSLMVNGIKHLIEVQSQEECCSENVNQVSGPKRFNSFRIIWRRV